MKVRKRLRLVPDSEHVQNLFSYVLKMSSINQEVFYSSYSDLFHMVSYRDIEIYEAIRRDDLALLMSCRPERLLSNLPPDDTNPILLQEPDSLMVAAFYGATKCFNFLRSRVSLDYTDKYVPFENIFSFHPFFFFLFFF